MSGCQEANEEATAVDEMKQDTSLDHVVVAGLEGCGETERFQEENSDLRVDCMYRLREESIQISKYL